MKVLSTSSSFGEESDAPLKLLSEHGLSYISNPHRKTLSEDETVALVRQHKPVAVIAGTGPIREAVLRAGTPELKVISRIGSGWDNIDRALAETLDVRVCRTPDSVTQPVVELTVGLFLDLARRISRHDREMRSGVWKKHLGSLVQAKTLGIFGCGRIGKGVALVMQALGCRVQVVDLFPDKGWLEKHGVTLQPDLAALIRTSDLISFHAEYSPSLYHLVNAEILSHAKRGLLLVNVARGGLIDEEALPALLKDGTIGGVALDVFEKEPYQGPLAQLDNVILTPHIGANALEARVRAETEAVENILRVLGLN